MTIAWQWDKIKETSKSSRSNWATRYSDPKLGNSLSFNASLILPYPWRSCNFRLYNFSEDLRTLSKLIGKNTAIIVARIRTRVTNDGSWISRRRETFAKSALSQGSPLTFGHSDRRLPMGHSESFSLNNGASVYVICAGTRVSGPFRNKARASGSPWFEVKSMSLFLRSPTCRSGLFPRGKLYVHRSG